MSRTVVLSVLLAAAPVLAFSAAPLAAQQASSQCNDTPVAKTKKSLFGSLLGAVADSALGSIGAPTSVVGVALPVGSMLSDAIINLLDCKEQQQAAQATDTAIRGGVGSEAAWKSDSRPNVSGRSKVTGEEKLADGGQCLTVTDIVIVDGEETSVPKRMCRAKGAKGFAKV